MNRRGFMRNAAGLLVAPWVCKAENLMRVVPRLRVLTPEMIAAEARYLEERAYRLANPSIEISLDGVCWRLASIEETALDGMIMGRAWMRMPDQLVMVPPGRRVDTIGLPVVE